MTMCVQVEGKREWQAADETVVQNGYETKLRDGAKYACVKESTLATENSSDRSLGNSCKNHKLEVVAVSKSAGHSPSHLFPLASLVTIH